jgi:hypothetical protein
MAVARATSASDSLRKSDLWDYYTFAEAGLKTGGYPELRPV